MNPFIISLKNNTQISFNKQISIQELINSKLPFLKKTALFAIIDNSNYVNLNTILNKNASLVVVTTKQSNLFESILNNDVANLISKIIKELNLLPILKQGVLNSYFYLDFESDNFNFESLKNLKLEILNFINKNPIQIKQITNQLIISNINFLKNFEFLKVSALFSKENKNLKRIHGVCSLKKDLLKQKITKLNNQYQKSHRYLNKNLFLYTLIPEIGSGFPFFLPNGVIVKNIIRNYLIKEESKAGFIHVESPILANQKIYLKSGHYSHYKEDMFPVITTRNNEKFMLRPMTCPHHIQIFKFFHYSYLNLPIRFAEHSLLFRYEHSGALSGLERVRIMQLTDAHLFVNLKLLSQEFSNCFNLIIKVLKKFNIKIDSFHFCKHDKNDKIKYYQNENMWIKAENLLEDSLKKLNIKYETKIGDAAFYGPKLDIQIKTSLEKIITISTLQIDFLSAQKFDAYYINSENKKEYPIIIHRGLIGTFERFLSILIEQNNGLLPLFLAPIQFIIFKITLKKEINEYALDFFNYLLKYDFRVILGDDTKRLNLQIRNATLRKINYFIFIGEEELKSKTISFRKINQKNNLKIPWDDFKNLMLKKVAI